MSQTANQLTELLNNQLKGILAKKYLLFDTCVLSLFSSSKSEFPMKEFFLFLNEINCVPGISENIYVEYMRGHKSNEHFLKAKEFLQKFPRSRINENRITNFHEKLIKIDRVNQKYGLDGKQVSYVDLSTAVFMQNWPETLYLATTNINDFSTKIFDIISIIPIIMQNRICLIGIIKANKNHFIEEEKLLK